MGYGQSRLSPARRGALASRSAPTRPPTTAPVTSREPFGPASAAAARQPVQSGAQPVAPPHRGWVWTVESVPWDAEQSRAYLWWTLSRLYPGGHDEGLGHFA